MYMLATMYVKKNKLDKTKDVPVTVLGGMRRRYCVALALKLKLALILGNTTRRPRCIPV